MEAALILAFTAGMVASVNPCAFSLLPAYVGAYVVGEDADEPLDTRVLRAVGVACAVSIGFVGVFGVSGILLDSVSSTLRRQVPWVTVGVGGLLVISGVAVVAGWKPRLAVAPRLMSGGSRFWSMVGFGASYAVASLSCTIGPFLAVTGAAMSLSRWGGLASYVVYALGMGVVILAISVTAALARTSLVGRLRRLSIIAPRIGGAMMILAGLYAIWYGRWELAVYSGDLSSDPLVDLGEDLRLRAQEFIQQVGAVRLAALVVLTCALLALGVAGR